MTDAIIDHPDGRVEDSIVIETEALKEELKDILRDTGWADRSRLGLLDPKAPLDPDTMFTYSITGNGRNLTVSKNGTHVSFHTNIQEGSIQVRVTNSNTANAGSDSLLLEQKPKFYHTPASNNGQESEAEVSEGYDALSKGRLMASQVRMFLTPTIEGSIAHAQITPGQQPTGTQGASK